MGVNGSALATETGDIVLMTNDIQRIPKALLTAKKVRRKIIENVIIAISTKGVVLGLAVAGHPLVWAAVLTDVGTCLLVIFNSMLLLPAHMSKKRSLAVHLVLILLLVLILNLMRSVGFNHANQRSVLLIQFRAGKINAAALLKSVVMMQIVISTMKPNCSPHEPFRPIEIPTSAVANAGASLTPSPVMAVGPSFRSSLIILSLSFGRSSA
ncbi:Cadmium/zinc-transporting ATPase HMA2 [Sesamum alatum]|uniref:Cadmium/zinc-transporting ATPase HMA2 n=1 Tax=Sesamum alatum TaxID=300844 RepID=A0AAE1XMY5_9LAMI|nr:Cadmium/zinc-transporting ATPase HMA2 [Sesamum alatum]